jgi:16S rRNA (cytidine1402-2'-O)-methyltransferase
MKTLESLTTVDWSRSGLDHVPKVIIARELTKVFEEVVTGSSEEVHKYFIDHPDHVRGEFVVMVDSV